MKKKNHRALKTTEENLSIKAFESRRSFLQFMGSMVATHSFLASCTSFSRKQTSPFPFAELQLSFEDKLRTLEGIHVSVLIKEREKLNDQNLLFGFHNDFLAIFPHTQPNHFLLAVNHEYPTPLLHFQTSSREKKYIDEEMKMLGVSMIKIKKTADGYQWIYNAPENFRIDGTTMIPLISEREIEGRKEAQGTFANCAGGKTPWGTLLTCEENFKDFVGDRAQDKRTIKTSKKNDYQWYSYYNLPPEHYGWVVEVDPRTKQSKKLTSLGRMSHEGATVTKAKNGRIVVYMGDDDEDRCLYKFISDSTDSLEKGSLYVANIEKGQWLHLSRESFPILKEKFKDQTELLIYTREAAKMIGGSPLDRPEDIAIDSRSSNIFIALTNNEPKNRPHGSILKIIEDQNNHGSLSFKASQFIMGGEDSGISCPDNLEIDRNGNLWFTTDIAGKSFGKAGYEKFGNNSLFFIPLRGQHAGKIIRVATAPRDAEFTGPCFSPDHQSLFICVQHPGETTENLDQLTSHWPDGGMPKSSVVILSGSTISYLLSSEFC